MFKNAITLQVEPGLKLDADLLSRRPARPCGALEQRTEGFTLPCPHAISLIHTVAGYQVICWETEDKILPGSVVADFVARRAEQIEEERGSKPGRKELREIKERVIDELLPKAFVQHRRTHAVLTDRYFIINTSSQARAEGLIHSLVLAMDVLPGRPLQPKVSPVSAMTGWVAEGDAPHGFSIDDQLELCGAKDTSESIRYQHHSVDGDDIRNHIASGKLAVKLGMTFSDRVSFILDGNMNIKRITLLDVVKDAIEESEDNESHFDAEVTLGTGEVVAVLDALVAAMDGPAERNPDLVTG